MRIKTTAKVIITDQLIGKINAAARKKTESAVRRALPIIEREIKAAVVQRLRATNIYQGLVAPSFGKSVRAEFGLNDDMAEVAAKRLVEIIEDTVNEPTATVSQTSRSFHVDVHISALAKSRYYDKLARGPEFMHNNPGGSKRYGGKVEIAWMEWLLERSAHIKGQYDITYDMSDPEARSRSGEAVMVPKSDPRYRGIYQLPISFVPAGKAENFIDQIATDRRFIGRLKGIAMAEINTQISRLK